VTSHAAGSRRPFARGAAIIETALVMSVVLLLMLASINLATIGFYQMSADAAAFFDGHSSALNRSCVGAGTVGNSVFTRIPSSSFSCTAIAGQNLNVPVTGYNFNSTTTRWGGYSIVQGSQIRTTVDATSASIGLLPGGLQAPILGESFEPQFDEYGVHYNADSNQAGIDWFTNRVDYFTQGENTPPYFVGYRIMQMCGTTTFTAGTSNAGNAVSAPWATCSNTLWHGLGLAEYLDTDNWGYENPGIGPVNTAGTPKATFQFAQCHQQLYVQFAKMLDYPPTGTYGGAQYFSILPTTAAQLYTDFNPTRVGSLLYKIYQQDNIQSSPPTFSSGVGNYPTNPGSGC
jgi:hypothetical protein